MNKQKAIRWIIQDSNYADKDRRALVAACEKLGLECVQIAVIPFSEELPQFPLNDGYENIYYGSTTLMYSIYKDLENPIGLFYDDETFSMENYLKQWDNFMLSSEAKFMKFEDFVQLSYPSNQKFFIRPDADSKAFNGTVLEFGVVQEWFERLLANEVIGLGPETKIMAGPAYKIEREWRNYIVNGKVVTSSLYMKNGQLVQSATEIPSQMIEFVETRCKEYQPHDVFTMDIAKCSGEHEYYIIECGCMNSVGFYKSDIFTFVKSLTEYVNSKLEI